MKVYDRIVKICGRIMKIYDRLHYIVSERLSEKFWYKGKKEINSM